MTMGSLVGKMAIMAFLLKLSSGAFEDVISGVMDGVSVNTARAQMKQLHGKLMEFYSTHQAYPHTLHILVDFFSNEFDNPIEQVMTDPWHNSYVFITPQVEILCCGPDKKRDTRDDLHTPYPSNVRNPYQSQNPKMSY
ncbi:MAG: hypothetical protein C4527_03085 [Candidatus Omnitrophota bacterium]|jgi:hypothetical protein|nr:MAG: hypothetical protein C4527_03085 [Candidatus Omnitrophota bacterium]